MPMFLRWPLPALLSWTAAWGLFIAARGAGLAAPAALAAAAVLGASLALLHSVRWRRLIVALGFPLSLLMTGLPAELPTWIWLLPLALLAVLYPRRSWGDAPLFPTPSGALVRLAELTPLPPGAPVLDAGCGLGHGLRELHAAFPTAAIEGIEWSRPLAVLARWRCRFARIHQGDMWAQDWQPFALVYVFQRPETMARVWAKACAELAPGAWLVSLDFAVPDQTPLAQQHLAGGHGVLIYRMPLARP
jgi:hypothetical protein